MDFSSLTIQPASETRLRVSFRLHILAASRFASWQKAPTTDVEAAALAESLFTSTLAKSEVHLSDAICSWRAPSLQFVDSERQQLELKSLAVCTQANGAFRLNFPLP